MLVACMPAMKGWRIIKTIAKGSKKCFPDLEMWISLCNGSPKGSKYQYDDASGFLVQGMLHIVWAKCCLCIFWAFLVRMGPDGRSEGPWQRPAAQQEAFGPSCR